MNKKFILSLLLSCVILFGFISGTMLCRASRYYFNKLVDKTVVMYLNKSNVLVYGVKKYMSDDRQVMPYKDGDVILMPVEFFAGTLSGKVEGDGDRVIVSVKDVSKEFDTVEGKGGARYADISELCREFKLNLHVERNGIVAYSPDEMDTYFNWTTYTHEMRNMIGLFVFDDVTGDELYNLLVANKPGNEHPRIMITDEKVNAIRKEVEDDNGDAVYKRLYEQLISEADRYLNQPASKFELRDGIRLLYVSREALSRIQSCALAYLLSGEEKYAECAYAEMQAVSNFENWNSRHFLDVGVMSMAVAFGYDWLYNWMTPDQRAVICSAVEKFAMSEVLKDINGQTGDRTYQWLKDGNVNNWRCVCAGGIGTAMLAMMDDFDGETLKNAKYILQEMLIAIRPEMLLWSPLGAFEEGPGYWGFAMSCYTPFIMSLELITGSNYGYVDLPGLNLTNEYLNAITGPACTFNYHCSNGGESTVYPEMMYLADRLGKYEEAIPRISRIMTLSSNVDADTDILLYNPKMSEAESSTLPDDAYFPVSEIASMRTGRDPNAVAAFLHCDKPYGVGGAGTEHMDAGTFSLQSNGQRWFFDLESDNYNISNLNQSYRFRAEGHNTVIFNPDAGYAMKKQGDCSISDYYFGGDYSYAVGNMTDAYTDDKGIKSFLRGVKLDKTTGIVTVQDEIRVEKPVELYWFAHTRATIAISKDGKSATLLLGDSLLRAYIVNGEGATFTEMEAKPLPTSPVVPDQDPNEGIRKLAIHIENCGDIDLCVAFVSGKKLSKLGLGDYTFSKISEWNNNSGTIDTTPIDSKSNSTDSALTYDTVKSGNINTKTAAIIYSAGAVGIAAAIVVIIIAKKRKKK